MGFRRALAVLVQLSALLVLCASMAHAAVSPEVSKGLAWLQAQALADGTVAGEAASIALPSQVQPEVANTIALLAGPAAVPPALTTRLSQATADDPTEILARRLLGLQSAGGTSASTQSLLSARRTADGGFAPFDGLLSQVTDSLIGLQAQAAASPASRAAVLAYVTSHQAADGGLQAESAALRVQYSAMAVAGLQYAAGDLASLNAARQLVRWLLIAQQVNGGWSDSVYLTAQSLNALTLLGADPNARVNARAFLTTRQLSDGSWAQDPFLTAVVLRALAADPLAVPGNPDPGPGTPDPELPVTPPLSSVFGIVVNPASGGPLAGVQLTLTGASSASATTGADGSFSLTQLPAGDYALTFGKAGFNGATRSWTMGLGQRIDLGTVNLSQTATSGVIKGRVTAAATGQPLAGVTVALSGSLSASRITDGQGLYEFSGVPAGAVTISATRTGYQSVGGTATLAAGDTLSFSPAMAATDEPTPDPSGRFTGRVLAAGAGTPLPGIAIVLNGATAGTTGASGEFDIKLAAGSYALRIAQTGYDVVTGSFVVSAGTITDAGTIRLMAQRTTSSVSGRVVNATTGRPVVGALVEVVNGASVKSSADGSYALHNLTGTSFNLRASAEGYVTQGWQLQTERPNAITQDFSLEPMPAAAVDLSSLQLAPASVGPGEVVALTAVLANTGGAAQEVVVRSQVVDPANKVVGEGAVYMADGVTPLGSVTVPAGSRQTIVMKWNSGLFAPGGYQMQGLVVQAGTMTRDAPGGRVMATRSEGLTIVGKGRLIGAAAAQPSVMRAGLGLSTQLSAMVQNVGNIEMPARSYRLEVIDEKTSARAGLLETSGPSLAVNELKKLTFGTWTPTAGGNFRLVVSAPDAPEHGQVLGKVYVGDSASAIYTVNKALVGAGDQSVRGKVSVSGQDIANGTISDPLAEPIRNAIQRSVAYNDVQASTWVRNNQCLGCHVVTQALVGGELTRRLTTPNEKQRNMLFNALSTYRQSSGAVYASHPEFQRTQTMLGGWALNAWHKKDEFASALSAVADYMVTTQEPSGAWSADYRDQRLWATQNSTTAFNLKSLTETAAVLSRVPNPTTYDATPWLSGNGMSGNYNLAADGSGRVIVANYFAGTVQAFGADGSVQTLMSGLSYPQGLAVATDGTIYVGTGPGVMRRAPDGTVSTLAAVPNTTGIAIAPSGDLYVTNYNSNVVTRITASGSASTFFAGSPLDGAYGIQVDSDGSLVVLSYNSRNVHRIRMDGTTDTLATWLNGNPRNIQAWRGGWLIGTSTGTYFYNQEWVADRLGFNVAHGIAGLADGSIVTGDGGSTLTRLKPRAIDGPTRLAAYQAAVSKASDWLLRDGNIDTNYAPDLAHRLIGLGSAKQFFAHEPIAATLQAKMESIAELLRSRQRSDGGWGGYPGWGSDALVTAQVGFALDYLQPSPSDPVIQNAILYLLSRQQADGSWLSENGILSTHLAATTWVEIWLPIALDRIGGLDTDLKLQFAPNVAMSNPTIAPTQSVVNGDGSADHTWRLIGVTSAGRDIQFDLLLKDLQLGESRPASLAASLTFRNSEGGDPVVSPVSIPEVKVSAFLGHGVGTDKPSYGANAPVLISSPVNNLGAGTVGASVEFRILSSDGAVLATLPRVAVADIAAGGTGSAAAVWNTGVSYAGIYRVESRLFDAGDRYVATAQATFAIEASTDPAAASLSAALQLDKGSYGPSETVQVTDRVNNLAVNQSWQGLNLITSVVNPGGSVLWTATATFEELAAGGQREQHYSVALAGAAAGNYEARLTVKDATGAVRAQASKPFVVTSSAETGVGLTGHLTLAPKPLYEGGAASIAFGVVNQGNAALTALPLTINIVDPETSRLLASLPVTVQSLATLASYAGGVNWTAGVPAGTQVVAVLTAQVGTRSITLAQDRVTVTAQPVNVSITPHREARVLALVSCPPGSDGGALGQPVSGGEATCAVRRGMALAKVLDNLGVLAKVVTTRAEFETELRCGLYNTYWISGGTGKLSDEVAKELVEAVRRGDSLIVDGSADARDRLLHGVLGVQAAGMLSAADQTITFGGTAEFPAGTLATLGRPVRYALLGAQMQASFAQDAGAPALATATFGEGHGVLVGFELARMLEQSDAARQALVGRVLDVARNGGDVVPTGAPVALAIEVSNAGAQAATAQVQATVPAGLALLSGQATSWNVSLDAGKSRTFVLRVKPTETGEHTIDVKVTSGSQTSAAQHSVRVQTPDMLAGQALALADAVNVVVDADAAAKAQAVQAIAQAQSLGHTQRYDEALGGWLQAADALQAIRGGDTRSAALAVAQALQAAERALCPQLACLSGSVQIRQGNQAASTLPVSATGNVWRQVTNVCPVPLPTWQVSAELRNRRTAQSLAQMANDVNLEPAQSSAAQENFQASAGGGLAGDTLEAVLVAQRFGWQHHLGRATASLTGGLMCDADGNGAVNTVDLELIRLSIGKSVSAGDPRDPDGNKVITINDVRACTARCTKPNCAQ